MRVIPIIDAQTWERDICARCVKPGHCCSRFNLSDGEHPRTFWDDERPVHEQATFEPVERWGQWTVEFGPDTGRTYSAWLWRCTAVTPEGKCSIYDDRPNLCRTYEPLTDYLCAMKPGA